MIYNKRIHNGEEVHHMYDFVRLDEIVDILKSENVIFKEETKVDIYFHFDFNSCLFWCKYLPDSECNKHHRVGVYLPNCDVGTVYKLRSPASHYCFCLQIIKSTMVIDDVENNLAYVLFCILHEVGHWIHFTNSSMSEIEFCKYYSRFRAPVVQEESYIKSLADNDPKKILLEKEYTLKYNDLPDEKIANEYAEKNIEKVFIQVKSVLDEQLKAQQYLESIIFPN